MIVQKPNIYLHFQRYSSSNVSPRQAEMMARSLPKKKPIPLIDDIIIVASGKGGVGKSTSSVNLAVTLATMGKKVGLLDADVFGPSVPLMMGVHETPLVDDNNKMIPPINYGVKVMSMGLLVDSGPVVWRGPLVMSALERLLKGTIWGPLDILIVDTPPGTGDIHLSLAQNVPLSGVVLVSTPQTAALEVTKRGADMYKTLKVPIIGLVENMSYIICHNCSTEIQVFENVVDKFAKEMNVEVLAKLPISQQISLASDSGVPYCIKEPDSSFSKSYKSLGNKILKFLGK